MSEISPTLTPARSDSLQDCFVIMPISDHDSYVKGHFSRVFEDIIAPACAAAGLTPVRADQVKQTNLIHLDILQKLLDSPMAICDLSSANPNVLFELGLRQAFDKPVVLIQEVGSRPIFDINPLRYTEYRKERVYHEVLEDQKKITTSLLETLDAYKTGKGVNSIVKLLSLTGAASVPATTVEEKQEELQALMFEEIGTLRREVREIIDALTHQKSGFSEVRTKTEEVANRRDVLGIPSPLKRHVDGILGRLAELSGTGDSAKKERRMLVGEALELLTQVRNNYLATVDDHVWFDRVRTQLDVSKAEFSRPVSG